MLDRYAVKDKHLISLGVNDLVIVCIKEDVNFPTKALGYVSACLENNCFEIIIEPEYVPQIDPLILKKTNLVIKNKWEIEKPLEIFYEQICSRVAKGLAQNESIDRIVYQDQLYNHLISKKFVPAGRILCGIGSTSEVTYFNCFVMPYFEDSRKGILDHRKKVAEIMSRGGGVGSNGSTLRPKGTSAKEVGGKSSGAVSWLNDLSLLTNLIVQGGTRRGAQMLMMADWHPDVIEFIIAKVQNSYFLQWLMKTTENQIIKDAIRKKLRFKPLSDLQKEMYQLLINHNPNHHNLTNITKELSEGGKWEVVDPDFLSGANISVCLTNDFMEAVRKDEMWAFRFPDINNYDLKEKAYYDEHWSNVGDVRHWPLPIKIYHSIKAKALWKLICYCATYAAEPGLFFIDRANDMTNAVAYDQKIVATNPCGEQPLTPYAVCNLGAINLAMFVDKKTKTILWDELVTTVKIAIQALDNTIDLSRFCLKENEIQVKKERRIGLGVMGLHDLLIWSGHRYGSLSGNEIINTIFKTIAITAYQTSIELAKQKGSFDLFWKDNGQAYQHNIRQKFINSGFMKTLPDHIRQDILKFGIRNTHLLTVAPTGTTGTLMNVSTGLEPYFAFKYFRSGRLGKFIEVNAHILEEFLAMYPAYNINNLPDYFVAAMDLTPQEHVNVQCLIQKWIDSSISKTINAPANYTVEQVQEIYQSLYDGGAKGGTVFVDGSRNMQVLSLNNEELLDQSQHILPQENGSVMQNIGDVCIICQAGNLINAGGCLTCNKCQAQLKCDI